LDEFLELLIRFEGLHRIGPDGNVYAYRDCIGILTVGVGTIKFDPKTLPWTVDRCRQEAARDSKERLRVLLKLSPNLSKASLPRVYAVLSFVYNLGLGNYSASTFKRRIDAGDWVGAGIECRKWCNAGGKKVKGLIIRREIEARMIETGEMPK
jgi:lysozyme